MSKHIAIYIRVSSKAQDHRSQLPDLQRWADAQDRKIKWYKDHATGKKMDRPGWNKLEDAMRTGKVSQVVVWRLDRLGRTVSGLASLFDDFHKRKINLVSLKDSVDLSTSAGRLMANVLASVAQYETELRGERVAAGQAVARASGKTWGGSKKGKRKRVTPTQMKMIYRMKEEGEAITKIAKAVGLSRPTIYNVINECKENQK